METVLVYSTWPDDAKAKACAQDLIDARIAACATILPGATSVYRWQGAVDNAQEVIMIVKTSAAQAHNARDRIVTLHPYELPCIITLAIDTNLSHKPFLAWVIGETS